MLDSVEHYYCVHNANLVESSFLDSKDSRSPDLLPEFMQQLGKQSQTSRASLPLKSPMQAPHEPLQLVVALSGGMDSVVLLALARQAQSQYPDRIKSIRAVYIDHQLQPAACAWQTFCADLCRQWQIAFSCETVCIASTARQGVESVARQLRYQKLASTLLAGELLLTGHHQNDQAETFLLNACRGAGVGGLAAMPARKSVNRAEQKNWLLRPLLGFSRQRLMHYAHWQRLCWIEDASNQDTTFRRNWFRQQVIPQLQQTYPQIVTNLATTAAHMQESMVLLDKLAMLQANPNYLDPYYFQFHPEIAWQEQKNLLRYWLKQYAVFAVRFNQKIWSWLEQSLVFTCDGAVCLQVRPQAAMLLANNMKLHLYNNRLYLLPDDYYETSRVWDWYSHSGAKNPLTANWQEYWYHSMDQYLPMKLQIGDGVIAAGSATNLFDVVESEKNPCLEKGQWVFLEARKSTQWYAMNKKTLKSFFQSQAVPIWLRPFWPVFVLSQQQTYALGVQTKASDVNKAALSDKKCRLSISLQDLQNIF